MAKHPALAAGGVALITGAAAGIGLALASRLHSFGMKLALADNDADVLVYHYYNDSGAPKLGINLIGYDSAGWPFVY